MPIDPTVTYWYRQDRKRKPHVICWRDPQNGRRRFRAFPKNKKGVALAWARELERELARPQVHGCEPWDSCVEQLVQQMRHKSSSYRHEMMRALSTVRCTLKPTTIGDLTPVALDDYFNKLLAGDAVYEHSTTGELLTRSPNPSQARKDWSCVRRLCNLMVKRGYLATNPIATVEPPLWHCPEPVVPETAEWIRLLEVLPQVPNIDAQAWHVYILLAATTGIDRDDLVRITLREIELGDEDTSHVGMIRWSRTKRQSTAKQNVQYHALSPVVNDRVASRIGDLTCREAGPNLFPWRLYQRRQWTRIAEAAGFQHPFKTLRRVTGTQVAEAAALREAADELGHSSIRITRAHYASNERIMRAIGRATAVKLPGLPALPAYAPAEPNPRDHSDGNGSDVDQD